MTHDSTTSTNQNMNSKFSMDNKYLTLTSPGPTPDPADPAQDIRDALTLGHVVTESIIVASIIILAVFLLVLLWTRDRLHRNFFNQFIFSLAGSTLLFSLFVRPGTIHEEVRKHTLTPGYCGLYLVLLDVEWVVIPYTLVFMTVERIFAVAQPYRYSSRFTKPVRVGLLALPWIVGLLFGIIKTFAMNDEIQTGEKPMHKNPTHLAAGNCYVATDKQLWRVEVVLGEIVANVLPILALVTTSIVLMSCYCRRRLPAVENDLEIPMVHGSSIFLTVVLDVFMVVVLVDDAAEIARIGPWVVTHWLFSALESLALILAITLLHDVRSATSRVCCWHDEREDYRRLINVNTSTQTNTVASLYTHGTMDETPDDNRQSN